MENMCLCGGRKTSSWSRGYETSFSCSTKLSMNISLVKNMKMPKIVGIFIFIGGEIFSKKEFAIVSDLKFISRTNFLLS